MCEKMDIFIQNVIFSSSLRSKIKDWKVNFEDLTLIFEKEFKDSCMWREARWQILRIDMEHLNLQTHHLSMTNL